MKRISKCISLMIVMAMLFMLVPVSALAADSEATAATAATGDNELKLVLITTEAAAATEAVVSEPIVTDESADTTVVPEQLTADKIAVPADTTIATPVVPEQLATSANDTAVVETETLDTQAATYLCLTQNGVIIDVIAANTGSDYSYNSAANELTLNNFVGEKLDVKSVSVPFKLVLLGTNILKTDNGFAVSVEGDMNSSGTGTLVASGQAIADLMGGGINVIGNLVIDSGTYDITATGYENSNSSIGILTGYYDDVVTSGNLTINGGNIDVTAYNSDQGGAFGLFAYDDLIINGGNIDVFTDSPISFSIGIGAFDNLVVNGGYTAVESITENNGAAAALLAFNKISINNGILDLCTSDTFGQALVCDESVYINPIYGDVVDLNASCLYLAPPVSNNFKASPVPNNFQKSHASSSNPKTGGATATSDAAVAGITLLSLIGLAYLANKREARA